MTGVKKKRSYRKSTPIGRLRNNVEKVSRQASLLKSRIAAWCSSDERVVAAEKLASTVIAKAGEIDHLLATLEASGFVPPEKARVVTWSVGQRVAVGRKFRPKYEVVFRADLERDAGYLDDLAVETILPTGEIAVRRRGRSPFVVPKTHLVEVGESGG